MEEGKRFVNECEKIAGNHCPELRKALKIALIEKNKHPIIQNRGVLPQIKVSQRCFDQKEIEVSSSEISEEQKQEIHTLLKELHPWRKGPFNIFGVKIDAEWESWMKWERLNVKEEEIKNKVILDIGASSGYYSFRCLPLNPKKIIMIDPSPVYYTQFNILQAYIQEPRLIYAPLCLKDLKEIEQKVDTIFCMGILYHQSSPLDALKIMKSQLKNKGTLILETLIWPGEDAYAFCPKDRYAGMANIYFIPTQKALIHWLEKVRFKEIKVISITKTGHEEQRKTPWMTNYSLKQFLDPKDPERTVEGHPAPIRIVIKAKKKV